MKSFKYLLLVGCALTSINANAVFMLNDDGEFYADKTATYTEATISKLDIMSGVHTINLTNSRLSMIGNGIIAATDDVDDYGNRSTIIFGQNGQENNFDFRGADWTDNHANLVFKGDTTFEVNKSDNKAILFMTDGGTVYKSAGSTVNLFVQDGTLLNDTDKLTLYVSGKDILNENHLYNMDANGETLISYDITRKSLAGIEAEGYTTDQANLLSEMMSGTGIYDSLTREAQRGETDYVKSALNKMLNPTQASNTAALNVAKENTNLAVARMAGIAGGEEAETSINLIPWIQGMFNHTNNTQSDGFTANTKGIALGIDAEINNAWMVGIGYSNVNSRIKTDTSSTHGYGNNGFIYGQYKPADWYVRGVAAYGRTTYKDKTNGTKWDVDSYSLNAFAGYIWGILDTSIGARYTYLDNQSYKSGNATIAADDTDNLTAVVDFKVSQDYAAKGWMITPSAHVGFTYDVISADNASTVALGAGYGSYEVNGERLHKAGVEAGTGVVFKNGNSEFHLNYEGAFRKDNYSNGGFVKFKYNF